MTTPEPFAARAHRRALGEIKTVPNHCVCSRAHGHPTILAMGRELYEGDFEVEVFEKTIAVRFWPTRSLYTFVRFTSAGHRRIRPDLARPCHSARLAQCSHPQLQGSRSAGYGIPTCDRSGKSGRDVKRSRWRSLAHVVGVFSQGDAAEFRRATVLDEPERVNDLISRCGGGERDGKRSTTLPSPALRASISARKTNREDISPL